MIKKLTIYSIILMGIFFTLAGCGKDEKLEGNHYKAYVNGKFKAEISFEKDEAKVISQDRFDKESLVKYEIKKNKDTEYLFIDTKSNTKFLENSLMDLGDKNNSESYGGMTVWQISKNDKDIFLKPVLVKTNEGLSKYYNAKLNLDDVSLDDEKENEIRLRVE